MKTKMIKLLLVVGVLASCTSDFKENDATVLLASATLKLQQEKVTAENSFYEGDLYRFYLNAEIEKTDLEIKALQEMVDNGTGGKDAKKKLDEALVQRGKLKVELGNIPSLVFRGIGPLPVPCPPKDETGKCRYAGSYFVVESGVDLEGGIFLDQKEIGKFQKMQSVTLLPKGFTAYKIVTDYKVFKKETTIQIVRTVKGKKIAFTAPLFLE